MLNERTDQEDVSLSDLNTPIRRLWKSTLDEVADAPDRLKVVVLAAFVDEILTVVLKGRLKDNSHNDLLDRIFDPLKQGFLSTYTAKVDLAYMLGCIDEQISSDLKAVGHIRNIFAHAIIDKKHQSIVTFNNPTIIKECNKLQCSKENMPFGGPTNNMPKHLNPSEYNYYYFSVSVFDAVLHLSEIIDESKGNDGKQDEAKDE